MLDVYIAIPYSHEDPMVRHLRCVLATAYAAHLARTGRTVHSPITHSHAIAQAGDLPGHYDFWRKTDEALIDICREIHVITVDGWTHSTGVKAEVEYAINKGKTVRYVDPVTWDVK